MAKVKNERLKTEQFLSLGDLGKWKLEFLVPKEKETLVNSFSAGKVKKHNPRVRVNNEYSYSKKEIPASNHLKPYLVYCESENAPTAAAGDK